MDFQRHIYYIKENSFLYIYFSMEKKKDSTFNFDSAFTYEEESKKYGTGSKNTFDSAFKYNHMTAGRQSGHLGEFSMSITTIFGHKHFECKFNHKIWHF